MKMFKLVAPALTAFGMLLGASARADDPPVQPLHQLLDFYAVDPDDHQPGMAQVLCIVAGPDTAGMFCTITEGAYQVGATQLVIGQNFVMVPDNGAGSYVAGGVGIEGKWYNPGSN